MAVRPLSSSHNAYILCHAKNGFILLDQQYAHERILYEENLRSLQDNKNSSTRSYLPNM